MSSIQQIGPNLVNAPNVLSDYWTEINLAEDRLRVKGKTIHQALEEQVGWLYHYATKLSELSTLTRYAELCVERVRGRLYKRYTENYSRELNDRQKDKYIDNEDEYVNIYSIFLEIKETREKVEAVVEAFRARGFALKNLLDAKIQQINNYEI